MDIKKTQWGNWVLNSKNLTLDYQFSDGGIYDLDIGRCNDSAKILDWIFQVNSKKWANEKIVYDLLDAIYDILNPQGNFCSSGVNKKCDAEQLVLDYIKK